MEKPPTGVEGFSRLDYYLDCSPDWSRSTTVLPSDWVVSVVLVVGSVVSDCLSSLLPPQAASETVRTRAAVIALIFFMLRS